MRGGVLFFVRIKILWMLCLAAGSFGLTYHAASAAEAPIPFQKEVNLIAGVSQSGGTGLKSHTTSALGFVYFRAFTPPEAGRFVLRMLATRWSRVSSRAHSHCWASSQTQVHRPC